MKNYTFEQVNDADRAAKFVQDRTWPLVKDYQNTIKEADALISSDDDKQHYVKAGLRKDASRLDQHLAAAVLSKDGKLQINRSEADSSSLNRVEKIASDMSFTRRNAQALEDLARSKPTVTKSLRDAFDKKYDVSKKPPITSKQSSIIEQSKQSESNQARNEQGRTKAIDRSNLSKLG